MDKVKIVVFVPVNYVNKVRKVVGEMGGGKIGKYSCCSFSVKGESRFKPEAEASPAVGTVGKLEVVKEERIEFVCDKSIAKEVITAIRAAHPYEKVDCDIYPLLSEDDL